MNFNKLQFLKQIDESVRSLFSGSRSRGVEAPDDIYNSGLTVQRSRYIRTLYQRWIAERRSWSVALDAGKGMPGN